MFQMLGVFSEFERSMIQSRVKAGIDGGLRPRLAANGGAQYQACLLFPHHAAVQLDYLVADAAVN